MVPFGSLGLRGVVGRGGGCDSLFLASLTSLPSTAAVLCLGCRDWPYFDTAENPDKPPVKQIVVNKSMIFKLHIFTSYKFQITFRETLVS